MDMLADIPDTISRIKATDATITDATNALLRGNPLLFLNIPAASSMNLE
jgi:hypothetical protein